MSFRRLPLLAFLAAGLTAAADAEGYVQLLDVAIV